MGVSASSASSQVQTNMITSLNNVCAAAITQNQVMDCSGETFDHCAHSRLSCGSTYQATFTCTSAEVAAAANKAAADASSAAQAAIGGSFSKSQTLTIGNLETDMNTTCNPSTIQNQYTNAQHLTCKYSPGLVLDFINKVDILTQCYLNTASTAIQTAAADAHATAKGWDPVGEFLDTLSAGARALLIGAVIIVIVIVMAVVGIIFLHGRGHHVPGMAPRGQATNDQQVQPAGEGYQQTGYAIDQQASNSQQSYYATDQQAVASSANDSGLQPNYGTGQQATTYKNESSYQTGQQEANFANSRSEQPA